MAFTRITDGDLAGKGVMGQPEVPGLSAAEMQASVEQIVREVAIPGVNRLADELEAAAGAASVGMTRPSGVAQSVPATVQGVVEAHVESRANPHAVTAAQVGAYTRAETDAAIDGKVVEIGAGDMAKAVYAANGETGVVDRAQRADAADDGAKVYTHSKTGTVHNFSGPAVPSGGIVGRVLALYDFAQGDSFTVNGQPYTAYMGAENAIDAMAGQNYAGKWLVFVADPGWGTLNFKGGGGKVTVTGLSADVVLAGNTVTVKQGAKTVESVAGALDVLGAGGGFGTASNMVGCCGDVAGNSFQNNGFGKSFTGTPVYAVALLSGGGTLTIGGNAKTGPGLLVFTTFLNNSVSYTGISSNTSYVYAVFGVK